MMIGRQKGILKSGSSTIFAMANLEGFRKALRLIELAENLFNRSFF